MTLRAFPAPDTKIKKPEEDTCLILPIAGQVNCKIRFAAQTHTSPSLTIMEAISWTDDLLEKGERIRTMYIQGPGDPLADPQSLLQSLDVLKKTYPDIVIEPVTVGLGAATWAQTLAEKGIRRITMIVNAVDAETARKIYAWIRPGKKTVALPEAVNMLLGQQSEALRAFHKAGISVHLQTTVYPTVNDQHIGSIARKMASLGACSVTVLPFTIDTRNEAGNTETALMESCPSWILSAAQEAASPFLEVVDYPENTISLPQKECGHGSGSPLPKPTRKRPNIAVASSNGLDVNLHLGQASRILIYGPRKDGLACLLEARQAPESGRGTLRWQSLARDCLHDCFILLVANAGETPRHVLAGMGIKIIACEDNIEGMVDVLYGGGKKKKSCT